MAAMIIWYVTRVLRKTFVYPGRAGRAEFWWWMVSLEIAHLILFAIETALRFVRVLEVPNQGDMLSTYLGGSFIVGFFGFLPTLAVTVRRLHDTGRSGWRILVWTMIPAPGWFLFFVITLLDLGNALTGGDPSSRNFFITLGIALALTAITGFLGIRWLSQKGDLSPNLYGDSLP